MRVVLIGNKCDMAQQREVSDEQIKEFLKAYQIEKYYETSALNGINVEKPFLELG
jgi:GTPase SAR1 family protein